MKREQAPIIRAFFILWLFLITIGLALNAYNVTINWDYTEQQSKQEEVRPQTQQTVVVLDS